MDGAHIVAAQLRKVVDGIAEHIEQTAFHLCAGGHGYRALKVVDTKPAAQTVGALHGHTAHGVLTYVLLYFKNQHRAVLAVDFQRGVDRRQDIVLPLKNHVNDRADYLGYFSEFIAHCDMRVYFVVLLFAFY